MADLKGEKLGDNLGVTETQFPTVFNIQYRDPVSGEFISLPLSDEDLRKIAEFRGFTLVAKAEPEVPTEASSKADLTTQAAGLVAIANAQANGYLKGHKAYTMIAALHDIPDIHSDSITRLTWLESCLLMEGFTAVGIGKINQWLIDNVEV